MFLDVYDLIGIIRYGNYNILGVFETYLVLKMFQVIEFIFRAGYVTSRSGRQ